MRCPRRAGPRALRHDDLTTVRGTPPANIAARCCRWPGTMRGGRGGRTVIVAHGEPADRLGHRPRSWASARRARCTDRRSGGPSGIAVAAVAVGDHRWGTRNSTAKHRTCGSTKCSTSGGMACGCLTSTQDVGHRRRLGHQAQTAPIDSQPAPCPAGDPVRVGERGRHGVVVHVAVVARRRGRRVARCDRTADRPTAGRDRSAACDLVVDPRRRPQRWTMPDMLTVVTVQQRDPIAVVIALEPGNSALHETERTEASRPTWRAAHQRRQPHPRVRRSHRGPPAMLVGT